MFTNNIEISPTYNSCAGCGVCAATCSFNAIEMKINGDGFFEAVVLDEKCKQCGLCIKVCSKFINNQVNPLMENLSMDNCFAGYSKNQENRVNSASGGIAYELASVFLEKGYKACGVRYNYQSNRAEHFIASNIEEYKASRGSKYLQSYTYDAFKTLFNGDRYIVFGVPCQIYGLKKFADLKRMSSNFVFVDLFCEGVPTYHLWNFYLQKLKSSIKIDHIETVRFRSKEKGWQRILMRITHNRGTYEKRSPYDWFYLLFFSMFTFNLSCYSCPFRWYQSFADIRLGDFWGSRYENDNKGVSIVLVNTEVGKQAIELLSAKCALESVPPDAIRNSQPHKTWPLNHKRDQMIKYLAEGRLPSWTFFYRARILTKSKISELIPRVVKSFIKKWVVK